MFTHDEKLKNILTIAKTYVPYYIPLENIDETNLNTFPIITREKILEKKTVFISNKYTMYDVKQMLCFRTSGTSTSQPLEFYWKQEDYLRSSYCIWKLRKKWYNININDKYVCFHTDTYSWNKAYSEEQPYIITQNNLSLNVRNLNEDKLKKFCLIIEKYKPRWIQFIPSIALKFVEYMTKNHIKPFKSVEYIEYNGETLMNSTRKNIDEFFGVKSANLYGSMEVNAIAYECPHHNMIVIKDNVFIEANFGKIFVTSLQNTVFPFIRYDLGDQIEMLPATCRCGDGNEIISKIYGRTTSTIQIEKFSLTEAFAAYCIDIINGRLCNIIQQYQFIKLNGCWCLQLYVLPKFLGWEEAIIQTTLEILKNKKIYLNKQNIIIVYKPIFNSNKKATIFNFEYK